MSPSPHAGTLAEWVADGVRRNPERTAVELPAERLSYAQLWELAGWLAWRVRARVRGRIRRVGLLAPSSRAGYVGYLAVLRLGATVVPLNPAWPAHRNQEILRAARPEAVLADQGIGAAEAIALRGLDVPVIDAGEVQRHGPHSDAGDAAATCDGPSDTAYILFTSGSTGRPKGVPIRHDNVLPYLRHAVRRYQVDPDSRLSQTFDLTFDPSVFDLFAAWGTGATAVVPRPGHRPLPVDYVNQREITHWFSVPSVIAIAKRTRRLPRHSMPRLRWSVFIGEPLTLEQAAAWRDAASGSVVENLYGPTELAVGCAEYRLPRDPANWPRTVNGTVPIGRIYPHLDHVLVDERGEVGEEGELCVRGQQRFSGYLRAIDDADRFVHVTGAVAVRARAGAPLDESLYYRTGDRVRVEEGQLIHLGRVDQQVKLSGYRVEPGEIEAVLRGHAGVDDAVVVVEADQNGTSGLHAVHAGQPVAGSELDALCRRTLPPYMVPRSYHHLPVLPLNSNGKVDRAAVRAVVTSAVGR